MTLTTIQKNRKIPRRVVVKGSTITGTPANQPWNCLSTALHLRGASLGAKTERGITLTDHSFGNGMGEAKRRILCDKFSHHQSAARGRTQDLVPLAQLHTVSFQPRRKASIETESGPLRAVHLSRHKWREGLIISTKALPARKGACSRDRTQTVPYRAISNVPEPGIVFQMNAWD